jgi:hypothetical protein
MTVWLVFESLQTSPTFDLIHVAGVYDTEVAALARAAVLRATPTVLLKEVTTWVEEHPVTTGSAPGEGPG